MLYFSVDQVILYILYIYVPQHSESHYPSPLLEGGPVQPVHHCADIRSIVVAVNLEEACSPSLYGFDLVNAFVCKGPIYRAGVLKHGSYENQEYFPL